jgi:glycerol dehydrogenase-like iron-containing ADH family enzyme
VILAIDNVKPLADEEMKVVLDERGLLARITKRMDPALAAQAVLHQPGTADRDEFRTVLAEALILSGMAMTVAGSSRPCSGGDHEILHAIDQLFPGAGTHGELAGAGALFCTWLRGDAAVTALIADCLARHGLPRTPADPGLSLADFTKAVLRERSGTAVRGWLRKFAEGWRMDPGERRPLSARTIWRMTRAGRPPMI